MKFNKELLNKKYVIVAVSVMIGMSLQSIKSDIHYDKEISKIEVKLEQSLDLVKDKNKEIDVLNKKIESASPWFKMKSEEKIAIQQENKRLEDEKIAKALADKEAEEKRLADEEKKGFQTGITYDDLARRPSDNVGEKIQFSGEVVQVMEDETDVQIRFAVNGDYDNMMYCLYSKDLVDSRILEGDNITIYGLSSDLITYDSTMGGSITIPSMVVMGIE